MLQVFDHIVPEAVVVLHSLSLHKLLLPEVAEDDPLAALHSLQTRSWSHTQLAPFLNPPNTISDEPAASEHNLTRSQMLMYCREIFFSTV